MENDDLKQKVKEAIEQKDLAIKSSQGSRQDVILRGELDSLRSELFKVDSKRQEAEQLAEKQASTLADLSKKVTCLFFFFIYKKRSDHLCLQNETLAKQAGEATYLRDQLDELKHSAEKLAKVAFVRPCFQF